MSHFVVGVIVPKDSDYDTLESILAPYDETAECAFKDCSEKIWKGYLNNSITMYRTEDDDLIAEYNFCYWICVLLFCRKVEES